MAPVQYAEMVEDIDTDSIENTAVINGLQMEAGKRYSVKSISNAAESTVHRLINFGLTPESIINLEQKMPVYIIKIGETELALDKEVIQCIYVEEKID
ncbi:MAG: ferrous iron transport protein A [Patescibacteria group bacterium]|nr:ferrous iron transport protein A [Patescibacteria group bacterium]